MTVDAAFCASAYLALRWVPDARAAWREGVAPGLPHLGPVGAIGVRDAEETGRALQRLVEEVIAKDTGILLSAGIDSAILASYLPPGTRAYTIRYVAPSGDAAAPPLVDESPQAARVAGHLGLVHRVIDVTWQDHLAWIDRLALRKRSPLHPVEVGLACAAAAARADGVTRLVVGNGADSTFGGLDLLLSRDWTLDDFVRRYTFVEPEGFLVHPVSMRPVYERYRRKDAPALADVPAFLREIHGPGITQAFQNALGAAGIDMVEPYERLSLSVPLDLERVRAGESKYVLRALYARRFPGWSTPEKIAFARPMDRWMADAPLPSRRELRPGGAPPSRLAGLTGEQRWLLFCLERFLDLLDRAASTDAEPLDA